jgi:Alw26I/Eco31I/Esp3I family type II restriction m6 adenine DNA methyltransferase
LVGWLIEAAASRGIRPHWAISLWDSDSDAMRLGIAHLRRLASELKVRFDIDGQVGDTFSRAAETNERYDVVITNPPWEALKPDRRELAHLSPRDKALYLQSLRSVDNRLARDFPHSQPSKKFAGWGTNLSRVGTEVAVNLMKPRGLLGIVTPASMFADQVSAQLRKWMFERVSLLRAAHFAAEARLFEGVDQPTSALIARRPGGKGLAIEISQYNHVAEKYETRQHRCDQVELVEDSYRLPFASSDELRAVLGRLKNFRSWQCMEDEKDGLWSGRELDETNHHRYLAAEGNYRFVKGRMIGRFEVLEQPSAFIKAGAIKVPATADAYRLAWRDVSRLNQKRRMQATIIPPGWVTGNSISIALFKDGNVARLRALLAVANSMVFEAQIRSQLITAHVSLGAVRSARLPRLDDKKALRVLDRAALACLNGTDQGRRNELEILVAKTFGISREEFSGLLAFFPKLQADEKEFLLDRRRWAA